MKERVQKLISSAHIASRRASEELIAQGRVRVNGETATLGMSADPELDEITVDGVKLSVSSGRTYIMLNKPRGYVTTLSDEKGRRTVAELTRTVPVRVYPVGRLDMYSEGLLIMTDDGEAANALMHPKHRVKKTYAVTVTGDTEAGLEKLRAIREVDGKPISPAECSFLPDGRIEISVFEGRNRQVRKMCEAANLKVTRLLRTSEGDLTLGNLPCGKWRNLTEREVEYIKSLI